MAKDLLFSRFGTFNMKICVEVELQKCLLPGVTCETLYQFFIEKIETKNHKKIINTDSRITHPVFNTRPFIKYQIYPIYV